MDYQETGYYVDFSAFPLVLEKVVAPVRQPHVAEMAWIYDRAFERQQPFVTISDARGATDADARYRRAAGEYTGKIAELSRRYTVASILVVDSVIARSVITAIFWWQAPVTRVEVVGTIAEAADLAEKLWAGRGFELTTEMRSGLARLRSHTVAYEKVRLAHS